MADIQKITIKCIGLTFKGNITQKSFCIMRCYVDNIRKYKVEVSINNSVHFKFLDCDCYSRKELEEELDAALFSTS